MFGHRQSQAALSLMFAHFSPAAILIVSWLRHRVVADSIKVRQKASAELARP